MAHAYTLSSFLSRLNPRRDAYGGTLENRLRLPGARRRARARSASGDDFPVGVRFLGEECIRNGYTVVDAVPIAVRLARAGVDYISLSAGGKFEDARPIPGEPLYPYTGYSGDRCMPGQQLPRRREPLHARRPCARALRAHGLETPVIAAGKIGTLELAEQVLERGIGRHDRHGARAPRRPGPAEEVAGGREDKVVRCVYGNVCKALDENFRRVDCTLWPKKLGQAPESDDEVPPEWPAQGAGLDRRVQGGARAPAVDRREGQRGDVRLPGVPRRGRRRCSCTTRARARRARASRTRASWAGRRTGTRSARTTSRATAGR